jgi:transcriptional regulator with XRE-family HTH domain
MKLIHVPTRNGCQALGRYLKIQRELNGWSLDRLCSVIYSSVFYRNAAGELEPYYITKAPLSELERGKTLHPDPTLLEAIAAVGYVLHPKEGRPYTAEELKAISCDRLDPETAEWIDTSDAPVLQGSLAVPA